VDLSLVLEHGRPLLLLGGGGASGAGALRACLEWQPVAAHAGIHPVSLFMSCPNAAGAPYVSDWDRWREAGVRVHPCFEIDWQDTPHTNTSSGSALEESLLYSGRALEDVLGCKRLSDVAVVLAGGLPSDVRGRVIRHLQQAGFNNDLFLVCEPF
jgi:hypothetical protein